jgi:serine/threonine-protein kinase
MSREVLAELGELFAGSDQQPREGRAIFSPLPVLSLTVEEAAKLVGLDLAELEREPTEAAQQTISDIAPGATIGERFEIVAVLGVGGMGVVYRARDRELGDFVALKVLKRELWHDPVQLNRLKDEIRLARKITHPNVLRTYDFGEVDGIPYISMEYVRGRTLRFLLDQSDRFPYAAGLRLARQLCAGLAAAHAEGVIHRDIKPENLLIDHVGNALLMDFGIARPAQRVEPGHTREGWLIGTPRYLAPEQIEGIQEVDVRADLYASGVLMYELFTGSLPFAEESVVELLANKLKGDPPSPREAWPEIPPRLEQIIVRCLQRDPAQRFQRATDLLDELNKLG